MLRYLVLSFAVWQTASCLSTSDLSTLESSFRSFMRGTVLPTAVRLAFHDCVGGCDGCLNVDDEDNAGLGDLVDLLEDAYVSNGLSSLLSRADYWAYASIYAIGKTIENANSDCDSDDCAVPDPGFNFQYGRVDCDTAPDTTANVGHPSTNLDYDGVMNYFATEFGFNENETTALMGAHTLGSAKTENSGHRGAWLVGGALDMNNDYYKLLVDDTVSFNQRDVSSDASSPAWQWNTGGLGMMLNTDMCLYKDVVLDADGKSSCSYSTCATAPTADLVVEYANSNAVWIADFAAVFTKMISHGDFTLKDLD